MSEPPRRGYVYYAALDKRRPVLVVSINARNAGASDVLVVPCSTVLSAAPTHVRLRRGEGGLPTASVLKCEQVTNLHKSFLTVAPLGGPLAESRLREVERAILRAIGVPIP